MDSKKYLPLIFLLLAAGCTTTARMTRQEVDAIRINCSQKQQQLTFLRSQMLDDNEQLVNGLMITSSLGFISSIADGTYQQRRDFMNGYNSGIRLKIDQIQSLCHAYPPY
jgi:hypothetical protein